MAVNVSSNTARKDGNHPVRLDSVGELVSQLDTFIQANGRKPRLDSEDVSERHLANLMYKKSSDQAVVGLLGKYGMTFRKNLSAEEYLNRIERFLIVNGYFPWSSASRDEEQRLYAFAKRLMKSDNTKAKSRLLDIIAMHDRYNTCDLFMDEEMSSEFEKGFTEVGDEDFYDRPLKSTDEEKEMHQSAREIFDDYFSQLEQYSLVDRDTFREACERLMSGRMSVKEAIEFPLDMDKLPYVFKNHNQICIRLENIWRGSGMSRFDYLQMRDDYLLKVREQKSNYLYRRNHYGRKFFKFF